MKHLILTLIIMTVSSIYLGATVIPDEVAKEHKEDIKLLKKTYKLRNVQVVPTLDGQFWLRLTAKNGKIGAGDNSFKMEVPPIYQNIVFLNKLDEGYSPIICYTYKKDNKNGSMHIWHPASEKRFIASGPQGIDLYDNIGNVLFSTITSGLHYIPGYLIITPSFRGVGAGLGTIFEWDDIGIAHKQYQANNVEAMITFNGEVIIEDLDELKIEEIYCYDFQENDTIHDNFCNYSRIIDKVRKEGGFLLKNHNRIIPCNYYSVSYDNMLGFRVADTSQGGLYTYDPNVTIGYTYRDNGEKYFEQQEWDKVIDYYQTQSTFSPWALWYISEALDRKSNAINDLYQIYEDRMNDPLLRRTPIQSPDTTLLSNLYKLSAEYANKFVEISNGCIFNDNMGHEMIDSVSFQKVFGYSPSIQDSKLGEHIKSAQYRFNNLSQSLENIKYLQQKYQECKDFEIKQAIIDKEHQARIQEETRLREYQEKQRQNAITISVLSFFANALLGNGSSSVKFKSSSIGSSSSNNNVRKSSNVDNRYLKDWESRKRDAEHWISVYEERLLKDPNDAATKHNLGKQRNILNNCNEQISRIKNGN